MLTGFVNALRRWKEGQGMMVVTHVVCISSVHVCAPVSHQNPFAKDKLKDKKQKFKTTIEALHHGHMAMKPLNKVGTAYGFLNLNV